MSEQDESPSFMTALVTEHAVLQSVASSTIAESSSRAALYLSALSSSLVAVGFASSNPGTLAALALTVFPTVFILGCFTSVRLIDTSVENIVSLRRIALIRRYYAGLHPGGTQFFQDAPAQGALGVRYTAWSFLFTTASMIIVVNSVLGGAAVALVFGLGAKWQPTLATSVGIASGVFIVIGSLGYERSRLSPLVTKSAPDLADGDELT